MTDLALTSNDGTGDEGDLVFDLDDFGLLDGPDEVRQSIDLTLSVEEGEYGFDLTFGAAWRRLVLVKDPDIPLIDTAFRALITSVPGVDRVVSYVSSHDRPTRNYSAEYEVETPSGETVAGGIAPPNPATRAAAISGAVDDGRCI